MNTIRRILLCAAAVLAAGHLCAQSVVDMAAYIDDATAAQLGESNTAALRNKINQIVVRNGMAAAEGLFAVVPTLTVTDDGVVDTGMTSVHVVRADLTLSVVNTVDNTVFASQTVSLQANGKSSDACLRSLVNRVNVNDVRFSKMIRDVQQSIADYYSRQMSKILAKVNSFIAREEYDEAMAALAMIPESVDEYATVADLKVQVYDKLLGNEVKKAIAEAEILVRRGDIDGALDLCLACNPLSPNYSEVIAFMNRLDASAAAAEAEAREAELRKLDAEAKRQRIEQEATAEGNVLKAEQVETSRKKGKSLGEWLFGL